MRRAWQLVRHVFELWGAVSLLASVGAGTVLAVIVAVVAEMPLGLRILLAVGTFFLVAAAGLALAGRRKTRPPPQGQPSTVGGSVTAGGNAYIGRDLTVTGSDPRERVWQVTREVVNARKAVQKIRKRHREDPTTDDWYEVDQLPTDRWNAHGGALDLSPAAFAVVAHAYELGEEFNDGLSHSLARKTFGDPQVPMPDLDALDEAFGRAEAALRDVDPS